MLLTLFFVIMTVCPHLANQFSPVLGMLLNIAALAVLILFGCHNPFMFNQSTLVLGYLLLYGYDVTGKSYQMRLVGMAVGAAPVSYTHLDVYKRQEGDAVQSLTVTFLEMWNAVSNKDANDSDFSKYLFHYDYAAQQTGFVQPYADSPMAVSYTHLDVYKRQGVNRAGIAYLWCISGRYISIACVSEWKSQIRNHR